MSDTVELISQDGDTVELIFQSGDTVELIFIESLSTNTNWLIDLADPDYLEDTKYLLD